MMLPPVLIWIYPPINKAMIRVEIQLSNLVYLNSMFQLILGIKLKLLMIGEGIKKTYSTKKASRLAYLSRAIYEHDVNKIKECRGSPQCQRYPMVDVEVGGDKSQALRFIVGYFKDTNEIVVCFRGSDNMQNWISNLRGFYTLYPGVLGAKVHEGFYQCFNLLRNIVFKSLKSLLLKHPDKKIPILATGHSLGGAIAALFAVELKHTYPDREVQLYTYGQPRVGNKTFCQYAQKLIGTVYLVIHDADKVPHLPSVLGYTHMGMQVHYQEGMQKYQIHHSNDKKGAFTWVNSLMSNFQLEDHSSKNYIQLKVIQEQVEAEVAKPILMFLHKEIIPDIMTKPQYEEDDIHDAYKFQEEYGKLDLLATEKPGEPYDPKKASILAYICKIIYHKDIDNIRNWTARDCQRYKLTDVKVFEDLNMNLRFIVGHLDATGEIVVCFRGTVMPQNNTFKNVLTDMKLLYVPYKTASEMKIHEGFHQAYQSISKQVHQYFIQLHKKYPKSNVLVTGHSLGGSIACLCALEFKLKYRNLDIQLYTFGSPRIGNKLFCDYAEKIIQTVYLIVHDKDPVPHYPAIAGYEHMGKQVHYNQQMDKYQIFEADQNAGAFGWGHSLTSWEYGDHSPLKYMMLSVDKREEINPEKYNQHKKNKYQDISSQYQIKNKYKDH